MRTSVCRIAVLGALAIGFATVGEAAELVLRAKASPQGPVVRLGDVAEIRRAAPPVKQELAALPLMPAPAPGTRHFLTARHVRDMLQAGGEDVSGYRFTGAAQVAISGKVPTALQARVGRLNATQLRRIKDDLKDAIGRHLDLLAGTTKPWEIELIVEEEQLGQLAETSIPWTIEGGNEPWTERQRFTVNYQTPGGSNRVPVEADISLPEPVVVMAAPVARGATIARADLALTRDVDDAHRNQRASGFRSFDEVIGKVARRSLREGQVLTLSMVEEPTLVRRGQTVKVVAVSHGIRVTTYARARQSGTQGELIYVESIDNRDPFAALVSGVREVQVLGR